METKLMFSVW